MTYGIKILSGYGLLLNNIAIIPFFNIYIAILYCKSESSVSQDFTCNAGIYILHIIVATFGLLILLILSLLFTMLYIDLNPSSPVPFSSPYSNLNLYRLVVKIFLPFYMIIDYAENWITEFIILMAAVYFI